MESSSDDSTEATSVDGFGSGPRPDVRRSSTATILNTTSSTGGHRKVKFSVLHTGAEDEETLEDLHSSFRNRSFSSKNHSFKTKDLLAIENGTATLVTREELSKKRGFKDLDDEDALVQIETTGPIANENEDFFNDSTDALQERIQSGDIQDFATIDETSIGAWTGFLLRILFRTLDEVNAMRFTRQLQSSLPFMMPHETYLVGQVIEALDYPIVKKDVVFILKAAFKNRNLSRIMVQTLFPRWDYLWHLNDQVYANRRYDFLSQLPLLGFTGFDASENFPPTGQHVIDASLRILLGEGLSLTRLLTSNRQALVTDDPKRMIAQNIAGERVGLEAANRNQFGNYFGRARTNDFRKINRLSTDKSIYHSFIVSPMSTIVNNGAVHVLFQVAIHWESIISEKNGNFSHHRMEQLDPFEIIRFHLPAVCVALSNLRGRSQWDSEVLAPFMKRCQDLSPGIGLDKCRMLAQEMKDKIILNLGAGVPAVIDPVGRWMDALLTACDMIEEEARQIFEKISVVKIGLRLGYDLITQINWKIPSDEVLKKNVLQFIREDPRRGKVVSERSINNALQKMTPRDKRTLIELVENGFLHTKPAQHLLVRAKSLLQREIRREIFDNEIRHSSVGEETLDMVHGELYWIDDGEKKEVYSYVGKIVESDQHRFVDIDSGYERLISPNDKVAFHCYIPVAEAITRAQKYFMNIELEHGKTFKYNAFMEFSYLRVPLRRLAIISQIFCDELDNARLKVLREVQRSDKTEIPVSEMELGSKYYVYDAKTKSYKPFLCEKKYTSEDVEWQVLTTSKILKAPPQSVLVVGGGMTGLLTTIHCTENVLMSGGIMKWYDERCTFDRDASTFERAEVVRLDSRWIAMLRYHLGTGFENVFIPTAGKTEAQLGNTNPEQGFVEITIKDLENMLHVEASKYWSKGLIDCYSNQKAQYDLMSNSLTKQGVHLKLNDRILRRVDPSGELSDKQFSWKVADFKHAMPLETSDMEVGKEYGIFIQRKQKIMPFQLKSCDSSYGTYKFKSLSITVTSMTVTADNWPSIYQKGVMMYGEVTAIILESIQKAPRGGYTREELLMSEAKTLNFTLDTGHTHVIECIGKPRDSTVHFGMTTSEPYGVCCIQGLKISMGMHNFGDSEETRIVGDFTKVVSQLQVAKMMVKLISTQNWQEHFKNVVAESRFPTMDEFDPVVPRLRVAVRELNSNSPKFHRTNLQTRFFETEDNLYLGMELTREYEDWKSETTEELVRFARKKKLNSEGLKHLDLFKTSLKQHIDRLWYEAVFEVIRKSNVYKPGARHRVPMIYTINSHKRVPLRKLGLWEGFRVADSPQNKYEIVLKNGNNIIARNVEGRLTKLSANQKVLRESNLTRAPDGIRESDVAVTTFSVSHYVNHRVLRLNNESPGYVFAFAGNEQCTPHFMNYGGLTSAAIGCMGINNFIKDALLGVPQSSSFVKYSELMDWSNGEVIASGVGSNFGQDALLRPGFKYRDAIAYLHSKVIECMETQQEPIDILSPDWKAKFAASMIPRGMEMNYDFTRVLLKKTRECVVEKFLLEVKNDKALDNSSELVEILASQKETLEKTEDLVDYEDYWKHYMTEMNKMDTFSSKRVRGFHSEIAKRVEHTIGQIIESAKNGYTMKTRITSSLFQQPKPVDSIVGDFAVEAQDFANSLVFSVALCAGVLALSFLIQDVAVYFAILLGLVNASISFSTITNLSRYKIRNEEGRILFYEKKFPNVMKGIFAQLPKDVQDEVADQSNPFLLDLEDRKKKFTHDVKYYGAQDTEESGFDAAYKKLLQNPHYPDNIKAFQHELSHKFIPEVYQENSYLQESLVGIYKVCLDFVNLLDTGHALPESRSKETKHLFDRLMKFRPRLENSLQRGYTYWGFVKDRKLADWNIMVVLRYFYSFFFCASERGNSFLAPIQTETLGILKETRELSRYVRKKKLRKEMRDLNYLYWCTRESEVASIMIVDGVVILITSWALIISRLVVIFGGPNILTNIALLATVTSTFGAILVAFHFRRKVKWLVRLWSTLGGKVTEAYTKQTRGALRRVRAITFMQLLSTLTRLFIACGAVVAFPWVIFVNKKFQERAASGEFNVEEVSVVDIYPFPFYICSATVFLAFFRIAFVSLIDYLVQFQLDPCIGEIVCEACRSEIIALHSQFAQTFNNVDPKEDQERELWEDVAREFLRKYRFDTIFAPDRFGVILQYIQSGMESRSLQLKETSWGEDIVQDRVEDASPPRSCTPSVLRSLAPSVDQRKARMKCSITIAAIILFTGLVAFFLWATSSVWDVRSMSDTRQAMPPSEPSSVEQNSGTTIRSDTSPSSLLQANPRDSADPPPFPFSTEAGAVDSELDVSTLSSILEIETESAKYNNAAQTLSYLESRLMSDISTLGNSPKTFPETERALQSFQKGVSCATSMFALGASCGEVAGCVLDCLELSTAEPSACRDSCGVEASSECGVAFDGVVAFCG